MPRRDTRPLILLSLIVVACTLWGLAQVWMWVRMFGG